jgi:hypothetical protein
MLTINTANKVVFDFIPSIPLFGLFFVKLGTRAPIIFKHFTPFCWQFYFLTCRIRELHDSPSGDLDLVRPGPVPYQVIPTGFKGILRVRRAHYQDIRCKSP